MMENIYNILTYIEPYLILIIGMCGVRFCPVGSVLFAFVP